jgi:hypothetical protein
MKRAAAVTAILFGVLAITFAASSYMRLRNLSLSSPPIGESESLDLQILTAGMRDTATPNVMDAGTFVRQLTNRIYATGGVGLALALIGAILLALPNKSQRELTAVSGNG